MPGDLHELTLARLYRFRFRGEPEPAARALTRAFEHALADRARDADDAGLFLLFLGFLGALDVEGVLAVERPLALISRGAVSMDISRMIEHKTVGFARSRA